MSIYKGSQKIKDTGSYGVYKGSTPIGAIYKGSQKVYMFNKSTTYQAGTTLQVYQVSPYCTKIRVDCVASKGKDRSTSRRGGNGGRVTCMLAVTPSQILYISVGITPTANNNSTYNASDIRTNNAGITDATSLNSRLIVAGGGGNAGHGGNDGGVGGAGGGLTGKAGGGMGNARYPGGGGTQSSGGAAGSGDFGSAGAKGSFGLGGQGVGGAGGAGWYGGGSGGMGSYVTTEYSGGGGGSSYTHPNLCSDVVHTQGYQNGAGYITITEIA